MSGPFKEFKELKEAYEKMIAALQANALTADRADYIQTRVAVSDELGKSVPEVNAFADQLLDVIKDNPRFGAAFITGLLLT